MIRKKRVTPKGLEAEVAMKRYMAGEKVEALAQEYNVSITFFSQRAKKFGLPRRVWVPNRCPHCGGRLK